MARLKDHGRVSGCQRSDTVSGDRRMVTLQVYCFAVHLMTFRSNDVDLAQSAASPRLSASGCSEGPEVAVFGGIRLCDVVSVAGIARKKSMRARDPAHRHTHVTFTRVPAFWCIGFWFPAELENARPQSLSIINLKTLLHSLQKEIA